jgi:uncharacterized protein (TIGR02996 family)
MSDTQGRQVQRSRAARRGAKAADALGSTKDLEARVRAASDTDWPTWLVFGDWLLEQGDVRGELIQLEHKNAERPNDETQKAIDALVKQHQKSWKSGLPTGVKVTEWRHGFVSAARVTWGEGAPATIEKLLQAKAARLLTALQIRAVEKGEGDEDDFDEDQDPEEMERKPVDISGLEALDFGALATLDLAYMHVAAAGADVLCRSPHLRGLTTLDLRHAGLGNEGIKILASRGTLPALRVAHLQRNTIEAEGAAALAKAPWKLAALDLRYNAIGAEGARALASAPFMATLERLAIFKNDVEPEGARALAACEALRPSIRSYWRGQR